MVLQDNNEQYSIRKEPALYIIATPIGNLGDITLRALEALKTADILFCEDTRVTKKLLTRFNISAKLESLNDHSESAKADMIIDLIKNGNSVGLVSDAGTPLISDPGYKLVNKAVEAGVKIIPLPGASSLLAALVVSGMPTDIFTFCGFFDAKKLNDISQIKSTLIFFESPNRLAKTLEIMAQKLPNRTGFVAREITKMFEEKKYGSFAILQKYYEEHPPKGEAVIVVSPEAESTEEVDYTTELKQLLEKFKLKEASEIIAEKYNLNKKKVYEEGLRIKQGN